MYSLVTLTGCYVKVTGDMIHMWKRVCFVTFGDDNVNSVDDELKDEFNQVSVAKYMTELFDLTYTAGDKSGEFVPYKTLEEVTFLKRSFVSDDDEGGLIASNVNLGWVAPLAKESFLFEPYWYKNSRDPTGDWSPGLSTACVRCPFTHKRCGTSMCHPCSNGAPEMVSRWPTPHEWP
jgi:hypothetical protein